MRIPGRRQKPAPTAGDAAPVEGTAAPQAKPGAVTAPTQPAPDAPATPAAATPAPLEPGSLDGLRAWVAQLDRKLGTRFYALGAATVLALAAGIVGIVLALGVKDDSATKSDLKEVRSEVAGVEKSASEAAQEDVAALGARVTQLETQLQSLRSDTTSTGDEISVLQDDIADLRDDVSALESSGGNGNP